MMGKGHAISGAAVWLSGCAIAQATGGEPGFAVVTVGTAVCAGWALAPDLDHPNSVVAHSAGPVTKLIAHGVARFGIFVHARTKLPADRPDHDGHRTVSHTAAWALLWGIVAACGQQWGGPWTAALLVFFATAVGVKAALPPKHRTFWVGTGLRRPWPTRFRVSYALVSALMLAVVAYRLTPAQGWWLGLAVATGSIVHCLGDCLTNSACPLLWPVRFGPAGARRAWFPVGPPPRLRFPAGGWVEVRLVHPLLVVMCAAALAVVLWPQWGPLLSGFVEAMNAAPDVPKPE